MNKRIVLLTLILSFFLAGSAIAQKMPKMDKSPHDIAYYKADKMPMIKAVYARPQKNGREVFGGIVKYDKVWRTGANEATEVTFYKDVMFGGKTVKAGTYSLFTIPGEKEWTIILNSDLDLWGAYSYKESNDVARMTVPVGSTDSTVEAFSIAFYKPGDNVHMVLAWDNTKVEVPFSMK